MERFDRIVIAVMVGLVTAIGLVFALGDHVGVTISRTEPVAGGQPPTTTAVRITFGEAMDPASVSQRFRMEPAVDGETVWEGSTFVFRPARPLAPAQTYTVTLEAGAISLTGRQLRRPLVWSFTPRLPGVLYLAPADVAVRGLWFIPLDGGPPREIFSPENGIYDFAPSPDGRLVAVSVFDERMNTAIWLVEMPGNSPRLLIDCAPGSCAGPAWSPDGKLLAYERREESLGGQPGPSRVWLYDLASGDTAPVYEDNQVLGYGAQWSVDGRRLAFFDANVQAIRVLEVAGGGGASLIPNQMGEVGVFSPDGERMAYVDIRAVGRQYFTQVWLADLGPEGGIQPLLEEAQEDQSPAWSPDGEQIAFARRRLDRQEGWGSQLSVVDVQSRAVRQLTSDPAYNNTRFVWDATGQRILIQRFELTATFAAPEIWVYDLAANSLTQLVRNGFGGQWLP